MSSASWPTAPSSAGRWKSKPETGPPGRPGFSRAVKRPVEDPLLKKCDGASGLSDAPSEISVASRHRGSRRLCPAGRSFPRCGIAPLRLHIKKHLLHQQEVFPLAEAVGFEPTRRCRLPDFELFEGKSLWIHESNFKRR